MPSGWRIYKARHRDGGFSGEGARRGGGRWNSVGVALVYLSEHQSLAALEVFLQPQPLSSDDQYIVAAAEWDKALVEEVSASQLPPDWRVLPSGPGTAAIGDQWVKEGRSAALALPSAIIPAERNFLLNPAHPDFRRIRIGKPAPFSFDPRMLHR
jgi:RES domain-containing protein